MPGDYDWLVEKVIRRFFIPGGLQAEQWMIFRGIFDLFSCTKNETNWINSIHQFYVLSLELRHSEPKKDAKSYSFLRCDVYICWESDLPWYSMLCYCVRKSKHRVNRNNTLLYSARFNLVKPSHADSKNVTQMEPKLSTTYIMLGIRSYAYFIFCAIVTTFYICFVLTSSKCETNLKELAFLW